MNTNKTQHPIENTPTLWLPHFPWSRSEGNKYSRGHALIYGGAVLTGASRLAARAAQRMGAGVVTLAAPESAMQIYSAALESVMVRRAETLAEWNALLDDSKKTALLVGPGMGQGDKTKNFVLAALATRKPCVLDADALTEFSDDPNSLFAALHDKCVLTPHEGEFSRLFGKNIDLSDDKISRTQKAAEISGCIVLLKGAETVISDSSGQIVVNKNAPPWLATAGAGDVLAGMILGLIAAGMPVFLSVLAAAHIHGRIAMEFGQGLIAEDIVAGIPSALKDLSVITEKTIVI